MRMKQVLIGLICGTLSWVAVDGIAQSGPSFPVPSDVVRIVMTLRAMSERLRLSLHLSTMGALSPTQADQRLYAGQVVNLLVGSGGQHYDPRLAPESPAPGLVSEARDLLEFLPRAEIPEEIRERVTFLAKKLHVFLNMALDESLQVLRGRRLDVGAEHMLRTFAFLNAALGRETDPVHLGGVLALLRILSPVM